MDALLSLAGFFAICFLAASSGGIFSPGDWYEQLAKPRWTPPNWAFPLVWGILFLMIAVAGWLVWRAGSWADIWPALTLYGVQLLFNAGWSAIFFGLKRPDLGLIEVAFLWTSILACILAFVPLSLLAALLMLPYLVWVSIAAMLNYQIWRLNRAQTMQA